MEVHQSNAEPWRVTLVDTGEATHDRRAAASACCDYVGDEDFCFTYGDGVADVDIARADRLPPRARRARDGHRGAAAGPLRRAGDRGRPGHRLRARSRTATAAGSTAASSSCRPRSVDYIDGDDDGLGAASRSSGSPRDGQLAAFEHDGFWQPMDTLRDKRQLQELWDSGEAPWKTCGSRPRRSGAAGACSSPATPASRAAGSRSGCSALGAEVTGLSRRASRPTRRSSSWRGVGATACATVRADVRDARRGAARASPTRGPRSCSTWPPSRSCARSYAEPRRDLRDQRDGHGERARGGARARRACAPWST